MRPADNLIDLKRNYPKFHDWMINAFTEHGFVYCISPKTLGSALNKLDINLDLPLFIKETPSLLPDDYIQYDHGMMDISNCTSDKSCTFACKVLNKLDQKINNPYNIHLSLASAKVNYPDAYKFLMDAMKDRGFKYSPKFFSKNKRHLNMLHAILINDPKSTIFTTNVDGYTNYIQLTSDGYWNLALCDSYIKSIALAIIHKFFNLVHNEAINKKASANSQASTMKYMGIINKLYNSPSYDSHHLNLEIPIISSKHDHATVEFINMYRLGTKEFLLNIPLFSKSQIKAIEAKHLTTSPIKWIPYNDDFYQNLFRFDENLAINLFNQQMNHYLIVLGAFYNKFHHACVELLTRTKDPEHPFKAISLPLSDVPDHDDICITSKELQSKAYKAYIKYYGFYAKRFHIDRHVIHKLKNYAKTMSDRQRYLIVFGVTGNPLNPDTLKFDALGFSRSGDCHRFNNVALADLMYDPKFRMTNYQYPVAISFNSFNNPHNPTVIPLDINIFESLSAFVKKFRAENN